MELMGVRVQFIISGCILVYIVINLYLLVHKKNEDSIHP